MGTFLSDGSNFECDYDEDVEKRREILSERQIKLLEHADDHSGEIISKAVRS